MDFGLFVSSATPSSKAIPVIAPVRHEFGLGQMEANFLWWCVKSLFWYVIARDICLFGMPYVATILKKAIEGSFKSEFQSVEGVGESVVEQVVDRVESSVTENIESVVGAGNADGLVDAAENVAGNYLQASLPLIESATEAFIENAVSGVMKRSRK
jgi:hypothetical protein